MKNTYESPLSSRYASAEMQYLFSPDFKFRTWRRLWIALARAEKTLGLPITEAQIAELERFADDVNYEVAERREREVRHDVMAHIYAYGEQCPSARPILHLGATSCYIGDNTDIIIMRDALLLLRAKLLRVISLLSDFALRYKDLPALAYTHLQPAQLTTVGKRATLWINELVMDLDDLNYRLSSLKLLGSKGTTGTQASFLSLFDGDMGKIDRLEELIAMEMGFDGVVPVSGQTYSRKIDSGVLSVLSGIAQSAYKFSNDIRILQSFKEMEEPFEPHQIGSSAMPYKRNPMRCERMGSPRPLCDRELPKPRLYGRHTVVRAHPRRFRQQAHSGVGGFSGRRRHPQHLHERGRRAGGISQSNTHPRNERASFHGHREHPDECRQKRRRPPGAA